MHHYDAAISALMVLCLVIATPTALAACSSTYTLIQANEHADVILVTGFKPFGEYTINPSQIIAEALNGQTLQNKTILAIILPVNFSLSKGILQNALKQYQPQVILNLGLAGRSRCIHIEHVALNLGRGINDRWHLPQRLNHEGPWFYTSTYNTDAIVAAIRDASIPVRKSFSAGLYVCNAVMYYTLQYTYENNQCTPAGFIHVPLLSSQDTQGMELERMLEAVTIALQQCITKSL